MRQRRRNFGHPRTDGGACFVPAAELAGLMSVPDVAVLLTRGSVSSEPVADHDQHDVIRRDGEMAVVLPMYEYCRWPSRPSFHAVPGRREPLAQSRGRTDQCGLRLCPRHRSWLAHRCWPSLGDLRRSRPVEWPFRSPASPSSSSHTTRFWSRSRIDEIDFPTKGFSGLTLRLYDPERAQWSLYWASRRTGTLVPPVVGRFINGRGEFYGDDTYNGKDIRARFIWSDITADSAHWEQAFSVDQEQTWLTNWIMEITRSPEQ